MERRTRGNPPGLREVILECGSPRRCPTLGLSGLSRSCLSLSFLCVLCALGALCVKRSCCFPKLNRLIRRRIFFRNRLSHPPGTHPPGRIPVQTGIVARQTNG